MFTRFREPKKQTDDLNSEKYNSRDALEKRKITELKKAQGTYNGSEKQG